MATPTDDAPRGRRVPTALVALVAQATQTGVSFLLQVAAARSLGADGFGVYALLFGAVVMTTAVTTGLVGDSLTVLDRRDARTRSALVVLAATSVVAATVLSYAGAIVWTSLSPSGCLTFAVATGAFVAADLVRRLLMATMHFWRLVVGDLVSLVVTAGVVVAVLAQPGAPTVAGFLLALAAGQAASGVTGWLLVPRHERSVRPWARPDLARVLRFGTWRAAQQFVRPTMLNVMRWTVLAAAGAAAVGELEAARVYVAPAMLVVQGFGSYLLSSYAASSDHTLQALLTRADRAAATMLAATLGASLLSVVALPVLGPVVTGGSFEIDVIAVVGWAVYAGSCAAVLPYGSLAAVRGRPGQVFGIRVSDSVLSIALLVLALQLGSPTQWAPLWISFGSFAGGILCRQLLIVPVVRREAPATDTPRAVVR
ncbi:hypothetical protein FE697_011510 [Mumia zhuanghuii]|uniref:Membrane protein involved in the export of O-antigen and teichoic acid n=2 Tax=Mumia TaxID=1546255 RepID=A0ABW1QGE9_9ACTN|nr:MULTISPECIES: hypothetical protein [Mumia]KAA1422781.1 hypothetical protein FE697_011510 [Mumia zhuanghuii]